MKRINYIFLCLVILSLASCAVIKPYDMVYLNDSEMDLGNSTPKNYEKYVHSIREGATPAGGSKSSGGCGCN